jgi:hypothetical protein
MLRSSFIRPLLSQGQDEAQRSIRTFCEAVKDGAGFLEGDP